MSKKKKKLIIQDGRIVSGYTFATRFTNFLKGVIVNDAASEEELEYMQRVASDLLDHQIDTCEELEELDYLKRLHPNHPRFKTPGVKVIKDAPTKFSDCPTCSKPLGIKIVTQVLQQEATGQNFLRTTISKCSGCRVFHTLDSEMKLVKFDSEELNNSF